MEARARCARGAPRTIGAVTDHEATPAVPDPPFAVTVAPGEVQPEVQRVEPGPIERDLAAVDAALARLDAGSYGTCEVCGDALGDAVLEVDPTARHCSGHLPGTVT